MTRKQLAALLALVLGGATLVLAAVAAVQRVPAWRCSSLACVALALAAGWYGVRRRGVARTRRAAASAVLARAGASCC